MRFCPKCNSGEVRGPIYVRGDWPASEHLRYFCTRCGFETVTPCKDAKKTPEPFAEYKLAIKEKANEP